MTVTDRRALGASAFLGAGALLLLTDAGAGAGAQTPVPAQGPPATPAPAPPPEPAPAVPDTHYVGLTASGQLYHTVRHTDGAWDRWGRPNGPDGVRAVASA